MAATVEVVMRSRADYALRNTPSAERDIQCTRKCLQRLINRNKHNALITNMTQSDKGITIYVQKKEIMMELLKRDNICKTTLPAECIYQETNAEPNDDPPHNNHTQSTSLTRSNTSISQLSYI